MIGLKKIVLEKEQCGIIFWSRPSVCPAAKHSDLYSHIIALLLDNALWLTCLKVKHNNYCKQQ